MAAIALLTTEGDAHACGIAHGRRFAREIADNVATYLRRFAASGLERDAAFAEAARWRKAIAAHNGAYAEEMRGIGRRLRAERGHHCAAQCALRARLHAVRPRGEARADEERAARARPRRLHHVRPAARGDRRSPHLARAELGLARGRARTLLRAARTAKGKAEFRLPHR